MIAKTYSTVTSGTVSTLDTKQDQVVIHNAGSLAVTLTVTLPASPNDGQKVTFCSALGVTTLTISSAITVVGGVSTLAAAGYWTLCYESTANKWFRIG